MQDMTTGKIHGPLVRFTIPLVLGNLFQLTYNMVDSVIVGRFVGTDALAAVGTANPVMNIAIFFVAGICMGASVLMSEFFGAHDESALRRELSTSMVAGCVFSLLISALGWLTAPLLLRMIRTPAEILPAAAEYLRIIFLGMIFTFLYNFYANTLRALGDSKTPLYFLVVSSVLNIAADLVFVVAFGWGVRGAAVATVLAQAASCACCMVYIRLRIPLLQLGQAWLVFDAALFGRTVSYSWASAMQQTTLYIGKLLTQGIVNPLGVDTIAAFNAVNRIDDFAFTPQQNIGHAMTTFLAQNRGAGKTDRLRRGFRAGIEIELLYCAALLAVCLPLAPWFMRLFTESESVLALGTGYLRLMAVFYILPGFTNGIQGYFRGMGELKVTWSSTTMNMVGRVAAIFLLAPRMGMTGIALGNLAGWIVMLAFEVPLLVKHIRSWKNSAPETAP